MPCYDGYHFYYEDHSRYDPVFSNDLLYCFVSVLQLLGFFFNFNITAMMDSAPNKKQLESNALQPTGQFLPDDLIVEILLFLDVQTLFPLKCLSKSLYSLISDPEFVKKHLKNSSQYPHLILTEKKSEYVMSSVKTLPVRRLLENQPFTLSGDCHRGGMNSNRMELIGSCNGLLCFLYNTWNGRNGRYVRYWFYIWNPATGTRSAPFGTRFDYSLREPVSEASNFAFGCDILTGTYKVLEFRPDERSYPSLKSKVRVLSLDDDDCWRNINNFPLILGNSVVHLSGTFCSLAVDSYDYETITHVNQFMIVSLDLSTETTMQFLLPSDFDEVPCFQPTLQLLSDHICFSHDFKRTEFVIWKMNEFGVRESWTRLFRIGYFDLEMHNLPMDNYLNSTLLMPLYLSKNGYTLILDYYGDDEAVIYDQRENRAERIRTSYNLCRFSYVESLVSTSTHWKSARPTPSTLAI